MIKNRSLIIVGLIIISLIRIITYLIQEKNVYLKQYNHSEIGKIYSGSQYIKGPKSERPIGDDDLYAFAGYYYLFQGGDISVVNFENPPIGKYLIGLSILFFKNAKIISIIYGLLLLIIVFKLSKYLINDTIGAISVFFLSFSPLFLSQLTSNMLDLPTTLLFTAGIYFYLKGEHNNTYYYVSSVFLGLALTCKFFPSLFFTIAILLFHVYRNKKFFTSYLKSLILIPLIYLFSHIMYFYYHPSLWEFFKYQYWILLWRKGNPFVVGNIIMTLYLRKYKSWWDPNLYVVYNDWNIFSPLITFVGFISVIFKQINKRKKMMLLWTISLVYLIYTFFGTTGVEKYILPVYPLLTILASYTLVNMFSIPFLLKFATFLKKNVANLV